MNALWLIPIVAVLLLAGVVLVRCVIPFKPSSASHFAQDGTFNYDPKEGMMCAVGGAFPGIALPKDLPTDHLAVVTDYLQACMKLGLALSFANPGYGRIFGNGLVDDFEAKERAYADLGFQPLTPKAFTDLAGWNVPLPDDEPVCARTQQPQLYAPLVRTAYAEYIESR